MAEGLGAATLRDVSVVVLSHNRVDELRTNLPPMVAGVREQGLQLIVVDNASSDGSREFIASLDCGDAGLLLVQNTSNLGVAGGRNAGASIASGDYILFVDDDTRIGVEDIRKLRGVLASREDVGAISPRVIQAQTGAPQCDNGTEYAEIGNYHGACHMVRRAVRRRAGDIDPVCTFGGEELDYSIKIRALGYKVMYVPDVTVMHNNVIRPGVEGANRRRMRAFNLPRLHFKYFPLRLAIMFSLRYGLVHTLSALRSGRPIVALGLPLYVARGALQGRRERVVLPSVVVDFYARTDTRPDFGNVPLWHKLNRRLLQVSAQGDR